ncbi:MAG: hypothetical protein ACI85O_002916 [Saprospiraceae bacterium]|jgi:hypothetical protein
MNQINIPRVIGAFIFVIIMVSIARKVDKNMEIKEKENNVYNQEQMIENVQLAVYSEMRNWILFENGTYVVVEEEITEERIRMIGIAQMEKIREINEDANSDYSVSDLPKVDGWSVNQYADGMYTYLHPSEFDVEKPTYLQITELGRSKRRNDAEDLRVICVSANGEIIRMFD